MLKEMLVYQKYIEKLIAENSSKTNWGKEYNFFKIQLKNFQHERLIHLLVTLTVGMATMISSLFLSINFSWSTLCLNIVLLPLFGAYIFHYRKLENVTQYWYLILKKLKKLI